MNTMNVLRVQSLAGFGLVVPDVEQARSFYSSFGLASQVRGDAVALGSRLGGKAEVIALPGRAKRLHHVSFGVRSSELAAFADHLKTLGIAVVEPPFGSQRDGLWFEDPWGTWINLTPIAGAVPPAAPAAKQPADSPVRVDRHLWRELAREVRPNRLGHMLLFTADWERAQTFYAQALGLRTADRAAGKVAFMAAGSGIRDHHCFGLINSSHRGFQHASFQVDGIDQIAFGAMQMRKAGFEQGFGPGRHALASNLFYYVRDPWGSWVEYYADMDKISEDWQAKDWKDLPYIWPEWAPEFWTHEMNANVEAR